jgi:HAE1 family hydrophobic/amphiphilic exporter-1
MNLSEIWIRRPVMTTLVMLGLLFFGLISYRELPINNLPSVEFPTISVQAYLPGASPETMAATVATPLEKQFSSISGIDSMVSTSTQGATNVNLQFTLERDIDGAALDVNRAIAAAMGVLPRDMPNPPTYQKVNPADMPIIFIALVSPTLPVSELHDYAENVVIANLSTVYGVAEVDALPRQKYAIRVQVDPNILANRGIGINEVANAIREGNVNLPGGTLDGPSNSYTMESNGQLRDAKAAESLIVTYQNGYPVRIRDLGRALDAVENDRTMGWYLTGGEAQRAVLVRVRKQPGANTVQVADRIKELVPRLRAAMPGAMTMDLFYDQSEFIEESIDDMQFTMALTIFLVVVVIFVFIGALKPTVIPSIVVPLSLVATFIVMSLLGYTLNNLSLMALTLAIGFVVDDAVVVLENIIRRMESGESALEASLLGSREIGFTVLSMTLSLVVVFVPIMFMSGLLGRVFREFAVSISAAILISGFLSLTLTPMLSSLLLGRRAGAPLKHSHEPGRIMGLTLKVYGWTLGLAMKGRLAVVIFTVVIAVATVRLFERIPKGFIPTQDQNYFRIFSQISDKSSFEDMVRHQQALNDVLLKDPDCGQARCVSVAGFTADNNGLAFISLKRKEEREATVDEIIGRLRPRLVGTPGLIVSLVNPPVITVGSRLASAQWQFTLQSTELEDLHQYGPLLEEKMQTIAALSDVKSDLQVRKPRLDVLVDRDKASALGLSLKDVQDAFFSAYSARQISTVYTTANYYYVILELLPQFRDAPPAMESLYIKSDKGRQVPLSTVARIVERVAPQSVSHSGQIPSTTISFNLKPGYSISTGIDQIDRFARETLPPNIQTMFQGSAQAFQASFASMGFLLIVTVIVIYLVLGILYESFIHPLTILTALPLAGFGALAALLLFDMELDMYAYVGMILLVGIVKKNGIMMVDFALEVERTRGLSSEESIRQACLVRFRPITMTTMAALFGTLPIALGYGAGGEARQPMGIAVVGGLFFSQFLTLYITPVFYVYMDKVNRWVSRRRR